MEQNTYRSLQTLSDSDYEIVDGEPNILGWEVRNETAHYLGKVDDLLFDPATRAVRYIVVDLSENGMNLSDKKVMIPIGIANLHESDDEVLLPNVHIAQFTALPHYEKGNIGSHTEMMIRSVIGSPAALRMEEAATGGFNQNEFYAHNHFDKGRFYQRKPAEDVIMDSLGTTGSAVQATGVTENLSNRLSKDEEIYAENNNAVDRDLDKEEPIKPWLKEDANRNQGGDINPNPDNDEEGNHPPYHV